MIAAASETIDSPSTRVGIRPFGLILRIVLGLLCIASSINEDDVIFDSYFFEQDEPRSVGIRREILKLIHRNLPFAFSYGGK